MVLLNDAIIIAVLFLIIRYIIDGETNYYGNYKFGRQQGTQSSYDRPASTNPATTNGAARHISGGFAAADGGGNNHVILPISEKIELLSSMENGYFPISIFL